VFRSTIECIVQCVDSERTFTVEDLGGTSQLVPFDRHAITGQIMIGHLLIGASNDGCTDNETSGMRLICYHVPRQAMAANPAIVADSGCVRDSNHSRKRFKANPTRESNSIKNPQWCKITDMVPITTPSPNGSNGERDEKGRFAKGNPGGPGNPHARQASRYRELFATTVTEDDFREIVQALVARAKEGDIVAAREVFNRIIGKPVDVREESSKPSITSQQVMDDLHFALMGRSRHPDHPPS
jgi:hypothetical protein